jgi:hypothetical protein
MTSLRQARRQSNWSAEFIPQADSRNKFRAPIVIHCADIGLAEQDEDLRQVGKIRLIRSRFIPPSRPFLTVFLDPHNRSAK